MRSKTTKIVAAYVRVSTEGQNEAGQRAEITRWLIGNGIKPAGVAWYVDKGKSGDNLRRPAFERLQAAVFAGEVGTVVVYKLNRLSRKLRDGINVLCDWCEKGLRVVSVTQQIDFNGTMGQMIASLLFGLAEMEQESRRECQAAGIAVARKANGGVCPWGGREPGKPNKATVEKSGAIRELRGQGRNIAEIARIVGLTRQTVYRLLGASRVNAEQHTGAG